MKFFIIIKEKSEKVRKRLLENFIEVVNSINPSYVVPSAGPPCFLEDDCFEFNFENNIFFLTSPKANLILPRLTELVIDL